jgi:hypothetical protein
MLQRFADPAAIAAEIERVRSLSGDTLRRCWRAVFGRSPAQHLTADLLRRMIANRVQEEAFGTLDRATLKLLDGVARRNEPTALSKLPVTTACEVAGLPPSVQVESMVIPVAVRWTSRFGHAARAKAPPARLHRPVGRRCDALSHGRTRSVAVLKAHLDFPKPRFARRQLCGKRRPHADQDKDKSAPRRYTDSE